MREITLQEMRELQLANAYAPETRLRLSAARLRSLGWQPHYGLHDILERLIAYMAQF